MWCCLERHSSLSETHWQRRLVSSIAEVVRKILERRANVAHPLY
jgi:hypothetical protein